MNKPEMLMFYVLLPSMRVQHHSVRVFVTASCPLEAFVLARHSVYPHMAIGMFPKTYTCTVAQVPQPADLPRCHGRIRSDMKFAMNYNSLEAEAVFRSCLAAEEA